MSEPLYSLREVATVTDTPIATVRRWVLEQRIPVERIGDTALKRVRVRKSVVDAFMTPAYSPPKPSTPQGVYFLHSNDLIKIGFAGNVWGRLAEIRRLSPVPVNPLGFIAVSEYEESKRLEAALHELFAVYRRHGEWFTDCAAIREHIATHAQPWPARDLR